MSEYTSCIKKIGNDYSGLILCLVVTLLYKDSPFPMNDHMQDVVCSLELIIGMEEFLQNRFMKV